jgi:hypothetical protein
VQQNSTHDYYDTATDADGNHWALIQEGWIMHQQGRNSLATLAPISPSVPQTTDPHARPADPRPRVSPPPPQP